MVVVICIHYFDSCSQNRPTGNLHVWFCVQEGYDFKKCLPCNEPQFVGLSVTLKCKVKPGRSLRDSSKGLKLPKVHLVVSLGWSCTARHRVPTNHTGWQVSLYAQELTVLEVLPWGKFFKFSFTHIIVPSFI